MKVNAPEKIYISPELDRRWYYPEKVGCYDTEYVRTDAFIEKACSYLNEKCRKFVLTAKDIEDFKNYIKGE